jgi:hypothetical protein
MGSRKYWLMRKRSIKKFEFLVSNEIEKKVDEKVNG